MNYPLAPEAVGQFRQVAAHLDALRTKVEGVYGMFHDALHGWTELAKLLEELVQKNMAAGMSREQALSCRLTRGAGTPETGVALHQSTLGERLAACGKGGSNEVALSNLCVAAIYSLWEDGTRNEIAKVLNIEKNDVRAELFSDLGKMRNVILHADGVMDQRARSLKLLKWFKPGDRILISKEKLHEIIALIRVVHQEIIPVGFKPKTLAPE